MKPNEDGAQGGNVLRLVRETADGLGQLVIQHVKLARLELTAELRSMGTRVGVIALGALLMLVGYTLALAGTACLIGGNGALGVPLLAIGGAHIVGPGVAIAVAIARLRRARILPVSAAGLAHSATALLDAARDTATESPAAPAGRLEGARAR